MGVGVGVGAAVTVVAGRADDEPAPDGVPLAQAETRPATARAAPTRRSGAGEAGSTGGLYVARAAQPGMRSGSGGRSSISNVRGIGALPASRR